MEDKRQRFTLDLEPELKQRLKAAAARRGVSMRHYCQIAIEKELAGDEHTRVNPIPFGPEALERLLALKEEIFQGRTLPGDSVDFIREARESRSHL